MTYCEISPDDGYRRNAPVKKLPGFPRGAGRLKIFQKAPRTKSNHNMTAARGWSRKWGSCLNGPDSGSYSFFVRKLCTVNISIPRGRSEDPKLRYTDKQCKPMCQGSTEGPKVKLYTVSIFLYPGDVPNIRSYNTLISNSSKPMCQGSTESPKVKLYTVSIFLYPRDVPKVRIYNNQVTNVSKHMCQGSTEGPKVKL